MANYKLERFESTVEIINALIEKKPEDRYLILKSQALFEMGEYVDAMNMLVKVSATCSLPELVKLKAELEQELKDQSIQPESQLLTRTLYRPGRTNSLSKLCGLDEGKWCKTG